jgi:anti-sigma factor RsiW
MKCEKAHQWISIELDGELPPRRITRLHAHLDTCAACQRVRDEWAMMGVQMRERRAPVPRTAEATWADVQRAIRQDREEQGETEKARGLGMLLPWATATLLIMILGSGLLLTFQLRPAGMDRAGETQVEFVETGLPDATPMVYEDAESGWTVIWIMEANGKGGGNAGT